MNRDLPAPGPASGRAPVAPPGDYHDAAEFGRSYDDAVDFVEAVRADDGRATRAVEERTPCPDCLLRSVAEIAWRLGDGPAARRAADAALDRLRGLRDGED